MSDPFVRQPPNWDSARNTDPHYISPEEEAAMSDAPPDWDDDSIPVNVDGEIEEGSEYADQD